MILPDWAKDPDAVLEKRRKAEERPSFWWGLGVVLCLLVLGASALLDAAAWLGGLKAMGWIK